jgi:cell division protein FtsB
MSISLSKPRSGLRFGGMMYFGLTITLSAYFAFSAVQGDYGVLRQAQTAGELQSLTVERDALLAELAKLKTLTQRLSDAYLDIDLLDEQVRSVLGYIRADEIMIR